MGIMQYLQDKKIHIDDKKWDIFSLIIDKEDDYLKNPEEMLREDKKYCVAGIYNNNKTKVKVGDKIYFFNPDTQTIYIDEQEYGATTMHKSLPYEIQGVRDITFDLKQDIPGKKSILDDFVIRKKISMPFSRTILFPLYHLDKATSRRREKHSCSLATCNACASEINNYVDSLLKTRAKWNKKDTAESEESNDRYFDF